MDRQLDLVAEDTLGAEFVTYLREDREMPLEQVADGFEQLVRALVE